MNTHMRKVKITPKGQNPLSVDQMSVRGNNIRWARYHHNESCYIWLHGSHGSLKEHLFLSSQ